MSRSKKGEGSLAIAVPARKKKLPGSRKLGNKKRKPSAKRYLGERRWEKNKARRGAALRRHLAKAHRA